MKISLRRKNEVHIFDLDGEVDFHTSPELRAQLLKAIEQQSSRILINLKKVSYIDSSGLATFVEALQKSKRANSRIVLAQLESAVRSVFEIARLDGVFSLADSEDEALDMLSRSDTR
ncbi:MAG: STAS domain-containing protein [Candidatus Omnitrophica bacterium]|nr:STAS domain-containing protein [Candidatus Omnitrophota bacterium]